MWIVQFQTRMLLLLVAVIALLVASSRLPHPRTLRASGNGLHASIVGNEYFQVLGEEDFYCYATRLGAFEIRDDGTLCVRIDRKLWPVEPPMSISKRATKIKIHPNGQVWSLIENAWEREGQLLLLRFHNVPAFSKPLGANRIDNTFSYDLIDPTPDSLLLGWIEITHRNNWQVAFASIAGTTLGLLFLHDVLTRRQSSQQGS